MYYPKEAYQRQDEVWGEIYSSTCCSLPQVASNSRIFDIISDFWMVLFPSFDHRVVLFPSFDHRVICIYHYNVSGLFAGQVKPHGSGRVN